MLNMVCAVSIRGVGGGDEVRSEGQGEGAASEWRAAAQRQKFMCRQLSSPPSFPAAQITLRWAWARAWLTGTLCRRACGAKDEIVWSGGLSSVKCPARAHCTHHIAHSTHSGRGDARGTDDSSRDRAARSQCPGAVLGNSLLHTRRSEGRHV